VLDVAAAQRIVDAAGIAFSVATCTRLHGGDNSAAYELVDVGRDAHLVAKVYGERMAWKMGKEVLVYGLLAAVPVPTPTILFADDSRESVDATYTLMTHLPGRAASTVTSGLGADDVGDIWRQIGTVARAFHTVTFDQFGYLGPHGLMEPVGGNRAHMTRILGSHLRTFRDQGGDPAVADSVERRLAEDGPLLDACAQPVLCHDDLHEDNVLVEPRAGRWMVSGVVDVENASAADPMLDLAKADYYAREEPVRRAALLEGYGPLPPDGQARLALYRLHHALALWSWFARIGRPRPLAALAADIARLAASA
jgi:aminoglycoside phosphotransferase (APT) family kinase protein